MERCGSVVGSWLKGMWNLGLGLRVRDGMRSLLFAGLMVCWIAEAGAQTPLPGVEVIMERVAANQDRSELERARYVYVQHARVSSRKGKTLRCEEITDTRVTPSATGSQQELLHLDGKLLLKDGYLDYHELPARKEAGESEVRSEHGEVGIRLSSDGSTDRDLVEHMRNNFTNDRSKDGIGAGLFPLTSKTQASYRFHLVGVEHKNGFEVFHVSFEPKEKDEFLWKGDAYIDSAAFQPVVVQTKMAKKIPFGVRTLLGTNLPGLGFTVIYAPQPGGVWFPVSFGTEFNLKVLFFFNRQITLSAENRDFEKTHVESRIVAVVP
ncbi:hypothetical protein BH10ACI4_BH10ACI4_36440 [soil metagenome]